MAKATLFTVTNPEAAIRMLWEAHPETKTASVSDEEAMELALAVLDARIKALELGSGETQWGAFPDGAFQASVDFAFETGLIPKEIDADTLFTNEFADFYNDFDAAEVEAAAESAE
jgi:NitT/TauT family transport system substrate-binding protein